MISHFINALDGIVHSIISNLFFLLYLLAILWVIHFVNYLLKYRLNRLGIVPRRIVGLSGILFSPFLHSDLAHLVINSMMLLVLSTLMLISGRTLYFEATLYIILLSGLLIWLFARYGIHIGASSLVMGYFGYLLIDSISHPSMISMMIFFACIYYFSDLLTNLFPSRKKQVSWEGHVFGFIAGIATNFLI